MPAVAQATLVTHLRYTAWATGRLLEACAAVPEETLRRDTGASHGGILSTLQHIYYADRTWLARLEGRTLTAFKDPDPGPSLDGLRLHWPALLDRFGLYAETLTDAAIDEPFSYRNLKGDALSMPRWQALLHAVNHATLHRGQVMAMLRQAGIAPPATDLVFFYLEQK